MFLQTENRTRNLNGQFLVNELKNTTMTLVLLISVLPFNKRPYISSVSVQKYKESAIDRKKFNFIEDLNNSFCKECYVRLSKLFRLKKFKKKANRIFDFIGTKAM